jgi:predicted ATPase
LNLSGQRVAEQIVSKRHNWPRQPTTFIGRAAELSQVRTRLLDPACCLLTVLGPGGIGKTRLAVQAAGDLPAHFEQGVYFVPLQGVASGEFLVLAIAEAVNFTLSGSQPPLTQVLNYLGNKTMLLVLDNFEQLIGQDGRMILLEILAAVPTIKLLVTSREALNLQEEWLFTLQGLPVPDSTQPRPIDADGAVALFTARAQQVRPDFSAADEAAEVLRICRLIEGVPLAVELAASWTKTLNCGAIADEIARSLDFLVTRLHNLPDRHRSMAAVFDYSWQRLSETEQQVFQRLSVFRGGFRRDAAVQVAGASLGDLAALVDKSLLRREVDDRYQLHELLRQYAEAQLAAQPEAMHRTRQAHCAYYAEFLSQRSDAIESGDQRSTVAEITAELDNVRAAWQWAIEQVQVSAIQKLTHTFTVFCHYQSHYLEAANTFEQVRACLANPNSRPANNPGPGRSIGPVGLVSNPPGRI